MTQGIGLFYIIIIIQNYTGTQYLVTKICTIVEVDITNVAKMLHTNIEHHNYKIKINQNRFKFSGR